MVVAYLRVTMGRQHLEKQKEDLGSYASANGFEIDKWIIDVVEDFRKEKEPSLKRVLARMKPEDKVIITDIARFGRKLAEVMDLLGLCMAKGVYVYSLKDRYLLDDSLDCQVISRTCSQIIEIEHYLMSVRTKEALNHQKEKGLRLGRPKGTDTKQSLLDAHKEEVMDMLERGDTIKSICSRFNISKNTFYQFKKSYGF
ncbi:MAG: recombinase family protein [Parabacteroides sp.]|nr:recombinase family protein [Parabacteroides sp.]